MKEKTDAKQAGRCQHDCHVPYGGFTRRLLFIRDEEKIVKAGQ